MVNHTVCGTRFHITELLGTLFAPKIKIAITYYLKDVGLLRIGNTANQKQLIKTKQYSDFFFVLEFRLLQRAGDEIIIICHILEVMFLHNTTANFIAAQFLYTLF